MEAVQFGVWHKVFRMKGRCIQYNGLDSVKFMLKEMPGIRLNLDSAKGECCLMSDGFKETRMMVQQGDYIVMVPKEESGLGSNAFFVFNPAVLMALSEKEPEEVKEVKKSKRKKSPLVQMMEEAAEEMSSPEYQAAARAMARAQAELNQPTL